MSGQPMRVGIAIANLNASAGFAMSGAAPPAPTDKKFDRRRMHSPGAPRGGDR